MLKAIKDIEEGDAFYDKEILVEFENKYKKWHENAKSKMDRLEVRDAEACEEVKLYLARQAAQKVEKRVLNNFRSSGMISEKIYSRLLEDMEKRYSKGRIT